MNVVKGHEICGNCEHDVTEHLVVSVHKMKGQEKVYMECLHGDGPKDLCPCRMDPIVFWKETLVEYRHEKPKKLKEPFT